MFYKLDLQSGFHQLRIREGDQQKTAFTTPGAAGAQYEWVTCPFGLTNTPSCFQRLMNHELFDHIADDYCMVYCDNVLIYTEADDPAEHMAKLSAVLDTFREHELLIKGSKTELFRSEVEYLDSNCPQLDGLQRNPRSKLLWNGPHHRRSNTCVPFWEWQIFVGHFGVFTRRRQRLSLTC